MVALTADQEERKKILVGINLYGNDYIESEQEGGPIVGHQYLEILSTQKPDIMWESLHCEHTLSYTDNNGKDHTVYYPTLRSIRERLDLAAELGCGVSMWEIGQGLDYFYDLF